MRTMRVGILAAALAALSSLALCQEFEVVSIKFSKPEAQGSNSDTDPVRFTAGNITLKRLIVRAYGVKDYQVQGPDWINSVHFDIATKFPHTLPKGDEGAAEFRAMMQKMLADHFQLGIHHEEKTFSVYGMVLAKGGVKFKESACEDQQRVVVDRSRSEN